MMNRMFGRVDGAAERAAGRQANANRTASNDSRRGIMGAADFLNALQSDGLRYNGRPVSSVAYYVGRLVVYYNGNSPQTLGDLKPRGLGASLGGAASRAKRSRWAR